MLYVLINFSEFFWSAVAHFLDCRRQEDKAQATHYHHCRNAGGHLGGKFFISLQKKE